MSQDREARLCFVKKAGWIPLEKLLGCGCCVYKMGTIWSVPLSAFFRKPIFSTVDTWEANLNITHTCSVVNKFSDKPWCKHRKLLPVKERCVAVQKPTHSSTQSCTPGFLSLHVHTKTHILCHKTVAKDHRLSQFSTHDAQVYVCVVSQAPSHPPTPPNTHLMSDPDGSSPTVIHRLHSLLPSHKPPVLFKLKGCV